VSLNPKIKQVQDVKFNGAAYTLLNFLGAGALVLCHIFNKKQ
jgi:hypothetical protein